MYKKNYTAHNKIGGVNVKENNNKDNNQRGVYPALYVTAAAFLLICFGIAMANSKQIEEKNRLNKSETTTERTASASDTDEYAAVEKSNVKSYMESTTAAQQERSAENTTESKPSNTAAAPIMPESDPEPVYSLFDSSKEMIWPVSGPIVMDYSIETGIFDKTLEQYRTNDSICISAPVGTQVVAAADGVITSILSEPVGGVTVCVDNGNGWSTTYSQLRNNVPLSEGQVVYAGDTIGQVGEPTKYSVELGPHLEFSVCEENKSVDPKVVLEQQDE